MYVFRIIQFCKVLFRVKKIVQFYILFRISPCFLGLQIGKCVSMRENYACILRNMCFRAVDATNQNAAFCTINVV